ncbi:DUF4331 family protein [bacterium]|nr:DUF4331 family protein [bacterium]
MHKQIGLRIGLAFSLCALCVAGGWWATRIQASDHDESPLVKADASMDITDLYVFDSGGGETTAIVCWAGFNDSRPQPDSEGVYNEDALYTLHIDNNGDNQSDIQLRWRFGRNNAGAVGVQFENVPGVPGTVEGPVETVLDAGGGARVWAGHSDDPFFFDAQGYLDTLATGTLSITSSRDFLAGLNVTAVAIEMPTSEIRSGSNNLQFWATASRKED